MQAEDIEQLTHFIVEHILRHGVRPEFSEETIADDIHRIMFEKWQGRHVNDISYHGYSVVCPSSWTEYDERIWRDWLEREFSYESWEEEIMYSLFGTGEEPWEAGVPGWREELHQFFWTWIQRDAKIVRDFDPMPELEEPAEEDHVRLKIDPYILEHGSAKQKRAALKGMRLDLLGQGPGNRNSNDVAEYV